MKIYFKTFNVGHLVSDREFDKLKIGFAKEGMELVREYSDDCDIVMVKGFSATWDDVKSYPQPKVYYSIGTEWKAGLDLKEANQPIHALYFNCDAVVHNSEYCREITQDVFGFRSNQFIIIPANEPHLENEPHKLHKPVRCISTAIWRPIKRGDQLIEIFNQLRKDGLNVGLTIYGTPLGPMLDDFSEYHKHDIYIQVSRKEGMPNTVLEALSYGLPCLVTNHGGAKEAVGEAGIILKNDPGDAFMPDLSNIEPLDYDLFKDGLEEIIDNYDIFCRNTRNRLCELNDVTTAQRFKTVFKSLL